MGRPRKFTPLVEDEIARRRAAGETSRAIAEALGTSYQNVDNAIKRRLTTGGPQPTSAQDGTTEPVDEFEAAQLRIFEAGCRLLDDPTISAESFAKVSKATNDTIKALRQFRALSRATTTDDAGNQSAEWVRDKLRRMLEGPRVAEAVPAQDEPEQATGTHGPVAR